MFKKFDEKEDVTGATQLKSSVQKGIRKKLIENYPHIEPHLEEILPKKENFKVIKCKDHIELLADHLGIIRFVKTRNTDYIPTLRTLHKYPFILPHQQVDKGAIKFILNGSSIMCPGLTSPGAKMTPQVPKDTVVAVMAEGKQHALAIGLMSMSSEEIQSVNKGNGIESLHYLNDGLWHLAEKSLN
uniref:PUA domain-containing protein n=1 Tax=Caenorhabditis tropicalis TaxID=1561998 RepID=A0A1I7UM55_9PELO